ncbi:MAG TPA: class I SAM-dependent methyltransferase [Methylomirabilota bacterium]|nr:class I SAM-dependent methyltransferase [Methylomirabilota bacterium]
MSLRHFFKFTAVGRIVLIPFRLGWALTHCLRQAGQMVRWAFRSREYYNHSYHLTDLNRSYLASYIALVSGHPVEEIEAYMRELEQDAELDARLREATRRSRDRHNCDVEPRYGRRLGWYALVRATKPRVIVETGVDRGLGTVTLAAAIRRNAQEGCPGTVFATDIVPDCGHLLVEPYKSHCRILLGDSVETLKQFPEPVDLFLHDSDHRPEYEWAEFLAIEPRLHAGSLVLSDNSQQSPKLREFARRLGRSFLYFQDQPRDHWWPGDGIGAVFVPGVVTRFQGAHAQPGTPL